MRNHLRPPNTSKNQLKSWYRKLRKIISETILFSYWLKSTLRGQIYVIKIKYDFENSKNKTFILDG